MPTEPTMHERILLTLKGLIEEDDFFPKPEVDSPEPQEWRPDSEDAGGFTIAPPPGGWTEDIPDPSLPQRMWDAANVADGPVTVTRDAGDEDDCELMLECAIAYVCASADAAARRARRDAAGKRVETLIAADRTLGLGVQVYARISETSRDDKVAIRHALPVAATVITIQVDYVGRSPAD